MAPIVRVTTADQADVDQDRDAGQQPAERRDLSSDAPRVHDEGEGQGRERQKDEAQKRPHPMTVRSNEIIRVEQPDQHEHQARK